MTEKSKIFVDGNCVVCSWEISHYKRKAPDLFDLVDISSKEFDAKAYGLTPEAVNVDMHVLTPSGELKIGVDAFAHIWSRIQGLKIFSHLIQAPIVYPVSKLGYKIFTLIRPYLPKKNSLLLAFLLVYSQTVMAIEEPKFIVESKTDTYEIRKYEPVLVAETIVQSDFENAGNQSFRILADYIFGYNQSQTKISMTAPVSQKQESQKIAMTAPVSQQKSTNGFVVQFTMPSEFTIETLPKPVDPRVTIKKLPAKRVAVLRYSGRWTESNYNEHLTEFNETLRKNNLKTVGEPILNRYDPPFMPWFLRRNEIWIELK
ncbi:MAG: heme-binding protein [Xanthomonadaceae bacterium]|nr:heme-binding protein [Xanthomonadaceae bacterium]